MSDRFSISKETLARWKDDEKLLARDTLRSKWFPSALARLERAELVELIEEMMEIIEKVWEKDEEELRQ